MRDLEALDEFFAGVREVEYLLSSEVVESSLPGPEDKVDFHYKRNSALCRASLVMLVAHFEGFIKAALAEFVEVVRLARPPARLVPGALLELLTRERIREIASVEEQAERINKTRKLFSVYGKLWDEERSIDTNLLSSKLLTRQLNNAGQEAIADVLRILDVDSPISKIQEAVSRDESDITAGSTDIGNKLDSIVNMRNKIAHGSLAVVPSATQVKSDLEIVSVAATAISRIISEKLEASCSLR